MACIAPMYARDKAVVVVPGDICLCKSELHPDPWNSKFVFVATVATKTSSLLTLSPEPNPSLDLQEPTLLGLLILIIQVLRQVGSLGGGRPLSTNYKPYVVPGALSQCSSVDRQAKRFAGLR